MVTARISLPCSLLLAFFIGANTTENSSVGARNELHAAAKQGNHEKIADLLKLMKKAG
eukprot:SAG11_NODE_1169_length_5616_cov_44.787566_6_plen_58_part_00